VRDGQFNAYQGDYQYFLDSNDDAAAKESRFAEKEKEVAQSTIKAKSKVRTPPDHLMCDANRMRAPTAAREREQLMS
jgi:hypothetical protein